MKILGYGQILSALKRDKIKLGGVEFVLPADVKAYVSANLPQAGSMFVAGRYLLVALSSEERGGEIVMFTPSGPPDPGLV